MIGADLRMAREYRGLTQADVVQRGGINADTLRRVEDGTNYPTLRTLELLSACLRIRIVVGPLETTVEMVD